MRSEHYRNAADVSPTVASRDFNTLVKAGVLISKGEKRGRIYAASQDLRNIYLEIRSGEPKEIADPFLEDSELISG